MSLAIFNGSPRGIKSNSSVIASWFLNGYKDTHTIFYLNKIKCHSEYLNKASQFNEYLFVMPLYVDGMPAQVKLFFESMSLYQEHFKEKKITFIIHSGFNEGIHNRSLEKYLNNFASIMNMKNWGIIILPGSEGFRLMPDKMTKRKNKILTFLGRNYMENKPYNLSFLNQLIRKEINSKKEIILFKLLSKLGLTNVYWNRTLKKNNAFKKRFDAPYSNSPFKEKG